jgi:hypothetical protein
MINLGEIGQAIAPCGGPERACSLNIGVGGFVGARGLLKRQQGFVE